MSTWTHITGCIRIDGIPMLRPAGGTKEGVEKILGNTCDFDSPDSAWDKCDVPCGSEGSLQYKIIRAGDGLVLWTVAIWGDLRDYDNIEEIKGWFNKVTSKKISIRDAVLSIDLNGEKTILNFEQPTD